MKLKTCVIENSNFNNKATAKLFMYNNSKFVIEVQEDCEDLFVDFSYQVISRQQKLQQNSLKMNA